MRKGTLKVVSFIISIIFLYLFIVPVLFTADYFGLEKNYFSIIKFAATGISALVFAYIIQKLLFSLNNQILLYRKNKGIDIKEQEKYENELGFISLTPKDENRK